MGVGSLIHNVREGNYGAAALDFGGVLVDGAATVIPVIPGGAAASLRATRAIENVADAGSGARRAQRTEAESSGIVYRRTDQSVLYRSLQRHEAI